MFYIRFFHDIWLLIIHIQFCDTDEDISIFYNLPKQNYLKKVEEFKNFDKTNKRDEEHIKIIDKRKKAPPQPSPEGRGSFIIFTLWGD